ncbi:MAG: sigma-70 family RNA polymerase sigma factor [Byssovorax sp.]
MDRVAALYRDHLNFVWRVLWHARMPMADIKDLVHDVFLVVLHKVRTEDPHLETKDQERAWLYTITINLLKNYRARARFRRTEPMDDHTNDFPDARNEAAQLADREILHLLLDSITGQGRAVFELVDLEGFTVVQAAQTLNISETNAHRRLGIARKEVEAAVAKLQRDEAAGEKKKTSAFLMPFGVGAWLKLRDLQNPPAGTADEIWERLQATVAELDRENERRAIPSPQNVPARLPEGRLLKKLAGHLKSPWLNVVSACLGGALVALLFLLRPNVKIVPLRVPGPVVFVTNSPAAPAPLPAPSALPATPPTDASAPVDETIGEEADLIRQARAAFAKNDRRAILEAVTAYERRFPTGRFRGVTREMRSSLPEASAR